jgi:hypothetical protein
MTTSSRTLNLLYMLCGLGIVITSIPELSSAGRTPTFPIITIASGMFMLCLGGYGYLYPEKTKSSSAYLLGAAAGFLFVFVAAFSLVHFYGLTGFFSTGDSTRSFCYAVVMLVVSVWLLFRCFSLRRKERR